MAPPEKNSEIREAKFKVKTEPGKPQTHHIRKNLAFIPRPAFSGLCGSLMVQTFSGHFPDDFRATLNNIAIYIGGIYSHEMGMTLNSQKKSVILQLHELKDNATKSTKCIRKLECKNYIVHRKKLKQFPKSLFLMLLNQ